MVCIYIYADQRKKMCVQGIQDSKIGHGQTVKWWIGRLGLKLLGPAVHLWHPSAKQDLNRYKSDMR
jgi:hypothetical protein